MYLFVYPVGEGVYKLWIVLVEPCYADTLAWWLYEFSVRDRQNKVMKGVRIFSQRSTKQNDEGCTKFQSDIDKTKLWRDAITQTHGKRFDIGHNSNTCTTVYRNLKSCCIDSKQTCLAYNRPRQHGERLVWNSRFPCRSWRLFRRLTNGHWRRLTDLDILPPAESVHYYCPHWCATWCSVRSVNYDAILASKVEH